MATRTPVETPVSRYMMTMRVDSRIAPGSSGT